MMHTIVFCLEEPSASEMLKGVLPRLLPDNVGATHLIFEGKSDLDKRLEKRIRGWLKPNSMFCVLRDKDAADCERIKADLVLKTSRAGRPDTLVRIACHELESFYLGDLAAVEIGLNIKKLSQLQVKNKFRTPDRIAGAADELVVVSKFSYQKIAGSRAISPHLKLDGSNCSHSFNCLIDGIRRIVDALK